MRINKNVSNENNMALAKCCPRSPFVVILQAMDIVDAILEGYPKPKKTLFVSTINIIIPIISSNSSSRYSIISIIWESELFTHKLIYIPVPCKYI